MKRPGRAGIGTGHALRPSLRSSSKPVTKLGVMHYSEYERERRDKITALAHARWLMRGCPEGSPEIDWYSAELAVDQEFLNQLELGTPV